MLYDSFDRTSLRRYLPARPDTLQASADGAPILEWSAEFAGARTLSRDGVPLVRLTCRGRRWCWRVLAAEAPPIRSGSEAEARQLALFYARRTAGA